MELILVHLTDIHIVDDDDFDILSERVASLGGAICKHITAPENSAVIFCITGDLAYSGKESQYAAVTVFLEEICSIIEQRYSKVSIHPVFVPGNHDCDFEDVNSEVRDAILASPKLDVANVSHLKTCTNIQKNYFSFVKEWGKKNAISCQEDRIVTENVLNFKNVNLKFHCFNTSWCSKKHEEKGKMKMLPDSLPEKEPEDLVITLMHHDAEWMDWEDKEVWNEYHKKYSDIILVGHDHRSEFVLRQNYDESSNYFVKGNQLYDKKNPAQSGFNILKINTDQIPYQERFFTYEWEAPLYKKVVDTGYHPFAKNRFWGSGIELKKEVWDFLEEMDIDIVCGDRKDIKLSDVFGFPTLKEEKGKVTKFYRDMPALLKLIEDEKFVSIRGEKEYGKTALIKQLIEQFYQMKKFPVLLDISQINTADGEALNKIVEDRYADMYNNIDPEAILQKDPKELVCFIDNFEEIKLSDKSAKKFLQYITSKFGYVLITRNHTLDILNPLKYVEMNDYIQENFSILVIQPTRRSSMDRIITKWLQLTGEDEVDSAAFDARRKEKYAQIHSVMKTNYFNKTPIDLLLVLSYLEQEQSNQLDYSRYSYVYDGLILNKLTAIAQGESGRISNNISIYKTILEKLAYKMYIEAQQGFVDEGFVIGVILDYKENHSNTKLKAGDVTKRLVEYSFLEQKESAYKFKHRYMYYYFVGSYIENVLPPDEKKQVIEKVFENIDDDVNYNVALFLAYRMNIEYEIIPLVKKLGEPLLSEYADFKYDNIRKLLEDWRGNIDKRIEKIYSVPQNEEIPRMRKKKMEELEEQEAENEEVERNVDRDEEIRATNRDVLKVGRFVDFMGNILKNYSGKMENTPREEGIDFIFNAALRIIGSLCNYSMYLVDNLIQLVDAKIKEGDETDIAFKSHFAEIIKASFAKSLFSFIEANLMAVAGSMESDILKENISEYCNTHTSEFTKMAKIEYLIRISATRLPVSEINNLFKGREPLSDISQRILKDNIYRYLTNYQYETQDRQAVCSILEFSSNTVLLEEKKQTALSGR